MHSVPRGLLLQCGWRDRRDRAVRRGLLLPAGLERADPLHAGLLLRLAWPLGCFRAVLLINNQLLALKLG